MTALPNATSFTGASVTEADFKTEITNLVNFLSGVIGTSGTPEAAQVAMMSFLGAGCAFKSASYTVPLSDRGKALLCSGSWALTLPNPATAGNGFHLVIKHYGSGTVTISAPGAAYIDATAVSGTESVTLVCYGGGWMSVGGGLNGVVPIAQGGTGQTSASAACDALGAKRVAAGYGGVGTPYMKITSGVTSNPYTVGVEYSISGLSGGWTCVSAIKTVDSQLDTYIHLFERAY